MRAVEALIAVAAERIEILRRYGGRRSLIAFGDVERIFDDATVLKLAKATNLPAGADTAALDKASGTRSGFFFKPKPG